jgi:hypothetical protein
VDRVLNFLLGGSHWEVFMVERFGSVLWGRRDVFGGRRWKGRLGGFTDAQQGDGELSIGWDALEEIARR